MKYIPLNNFNEFDENPFLEKAIKEIEEHRIKKRVFVRGNKSVINQVINNEGEIVAQSAFLKTIEVDEAQFVKVYLNRFASFYELTKPARKVLGYILTNCLIPNKDVFYIDFNEAKQETGYSADNIIRAGLSCLLENDIIARSTNPYRYYINPLTVFNGNRLAFAEIYVKKRKSKNEEEDKNQLSIW